MKKLVGLLIALTTFFSLSSRLLLTDDSSLHIELPDDAMITFAIDDYYEAFSLEATQHVFEQEKVRASLAPHTFIFDTVEVLSENVISSFASRFWDVFQIAVSLDLMQQSHALARRFIKDAGMTSFSLEFLPEDGISQEVEDVIRKQYFLMTDDHSVMGDLTLTYQEVVSSKMIKIENTRANFSNLHLRSVEGISFYAHPQCQQLDLSNNQITHLPDEIKKLRELTNLNVNNNKLSTLPPSIGSLKKLRRLDCAENEITHLPQTLSNLTQLGRVDLNNNKLNHLPQSLVFVPNLRWLSANGNSIKKVPESVGMMKHLMYLSLNNNQLEELPAELSSAPSLHQLHCQDNKGLIIPEEIRGMPSLLVLGE